MVEMSSVDAPLGWQRQRMRNHDTILTHELDRHGHRGRVRVHEEQIGVKEGAGRSFGEHERLLALDRTPHQHALGVLESIRIRRGDQDAVEARFQRHVLERPRIRRRHRLRNVAEADEQLDRHRIRIDDRAAHRDRRIQRRGVRAGLRHGQHRRQILVVDDQEFQHAHEAAENVLRDAHADRFGRLAECVVEDRDRDGLLDFASFVVQHFEARHEILIGCRSGRQGEARLHFETQVRGHGVVAAPPYHDSALRIPFFTRLERRRLGDERYRLEINRDRDHRRDGRPELRCHSGAWHDRVQSQNAADGERGVERAGARIHVEPGDIGSIDTQAADQRGRQVVRSFAMERICGGIDVVEQPRKVGPRDRHEAGTVLEAVRGIGPVHVPLEVHATRGGHQREALRLIGHAERRPRWRDLGRPAGRPASRRQCGGPARTPVRPC